METNENYQVLCKSKKYQIVKTRIDYRTEALKGEYVKSVGHITIPKELAEHYVDMLNEHLDYPVKERKEIKAAAISDFDYENDKDFDNEHSELYPEKYK